MERKPMDASTLATLILFLNDECLLAWELDWIAADEAFESAESDEERLSMAEAIAEPIEAVASARARAAWLRDVTSEDVWACVQAEIGDFTKGASCKEDEPTRRWARALHDVVHGDDERDRSGMDLYLGLFKSLHEASVAKSVAGTVFSLLKGEPWE
jgi:hypothetical protein